MKNLLSKFYGRTFFGYCKYCGSPQTVPTAHQTLIGRAIPFNILCSVRECSMCGGKEIYKKEKIPKVIKEVY